MTREKPVYPTQETCWENVQLLFSTEQRTPEHEGSTHEGSKHEGSKAKLKIDPISTTTQEAAVSISAGLSF